MLKQLTLQNIAIIERLSIPLGGGFTVVTGETGAGKSILLSAIALAFGAKVSAKDVLRHGQSQGSVELLVELPENPSLQTTIRQQLQDAGVELSVDESEVLIYREFSEKGSRCRLNGIPVARELLAQLRGSLVDLHGQHELTSLFDSETYLHCLDLLGQTNLKQATTKGRNDYQKLLDNVANSYQQWRKLSQEFQQLSENRQVEERQREFARFQLQELSEAGLTDADEDSRIQQELSRLSHTEALHQASSEATYLLRGHDESESNASVLDQLARIEKALSAVSGHDPQLDALTESMAQLGENALMLSRQLGDYQDGLTSDPAQLDQLMNRVDQLEKIKRKYGPTLADAIDLQASLEDTYADDTDIEARLQALKKQVTALASSFEQAAESLHQARRNIASHLKQQLVEALESLALPGVRFEIAFEKTAYQASGTDSVQFLFSANPGEPLRPLAKVASGGELSRFLLALKSLIADAAGVETLIFDEIDTGISGVTAKAVAEKLVTLSRNRQVIAITHQPIVAARGEHHLHVSKQAKTPKANASDEVGMDVQAEILHEKERRLAILSRLASGIDTDDESVEKFVSRLLAQN